MENNSILCAIGYRADNGTVRHEASFNLAELPQSAINDLIARGIYSAMAEYKTTNNPQSETEFKALMAGFDTVKLVEFLARPKARGRVANEYPQQMRVLDAGILVKTQAKALRLNRFLPLVATPELDLTDLVKNKHQSEIADIGYGDMLQAWDKAISEGIQFDSGVLGAYERIKGWMLALS